MEARFVIEEILLNMKRGKTGMTKYYSVQLEYEVSI